MNDTASMTGATTVPPTTPPPKPPTTPIASAPRSSRFGLNPLWVKGWRGRCRPKHLVSRGVVILTFSIFISLMTYIPVTERELATSVDAAKAVIPGIVVIQAILLMMFGTGAVAGGISRERDTGLLDYQRMTPMSPVARIIGHLFGLPIREYVLVLMLMPLVGIAAWVGEFSLLTLLKFYAVFFTSVLVYHMTALVAGMVSPKPRLAQLTSIGLVAVLYLVLPNLSRLGITFFEFLTIRPTFFGLIQQELPESLRPQLEASGIDSFRDVPFFDGALHPTVYTMLVQGFVLAIMFAIVHRKWRNETSHVLSKAGAVAVFGGIVTFFLGSVWAIVRQDEAYRQVFGALSGMMGQDGRAPESLAVLLVVAAAILAGAFLLLVAMITPERNTTLEGWRRARKQGRSRLGWNADAASSLPASLIMMGLTIAAGTVVMVIVIRGGEYMASGPELASVVILVAGLVGTGLFVQGVRSRFSFRVFAVGVFLLWMIPFFAMLILIAAFDDAVFATYVGLPCPPVTLGWSIAHMLQMSEALPGVSSQLMPSEIAEHGYRLTATGSGGYLVAGLLAQAASMRHRRRLRGAGTSSDTGAGAGAGSEVDVLTDSA